MRVVAVGVVSAALLITASSPSPVLAQAVPRGYTPEECPSCASWNRPTTPFKLFGDSYWVGTRGLGAILITSDVGHVLIDTGLPESAPLILDNVRALGFEPTDIEIIVISHPHYDHAGGTAEVQRASGAVVKAMPAAATALRRGVPGPDDPQHGSALPFPPVNGVDLLSPGDTVRVGPIALVAHLTPGHSPGGTTWSWPACEGGRCIDLVYADSQTPVSDEGFRFSEGDRAGEFERGLALIATLRCDLLVTPHPGASGMWDRISARERGDWGPLLDPDACRRYAENGRQQLSGRLAREGAPPAASSTAELRVTLVGNAGVTLSDGETTLLVDLPYESGAFGYQTYDPAALAPVGETVAVITHHHRDHFDPGLLLPRERWQVIGPPSVTGAVPSDRVMQGDSVVVGAFSVLAVPTPHTEDHRSYRIRWRGRVFHVTGDTEATDHLVGSPPVDVLLATPWFTCAAVEGGILRKAARTIVYHQSPAGDDAVCGEVEALAQGSSFSLEARDRR